MIDTSIVKTSFERIKNLTIEHIAQMKGGFDNGSITRGVYWKLYASLLEEIGEVATALKVEHGVVKHKTLDESSNSEMADVAICAIMLYYALGGQTEKVKIINYLAEDDFAERNKETHKDQFASLAYISFKASEIAVSIKNSTDGYTYAMDIFGEAVNFCLAWNLPPDLFFVSMNTKLDKWEGNQKAHA